MQGIPTVKKQKHKRKEISHGKGLYTAVVFDSSFTLDLLLVTQFLQMVRLLDFLRQQ
jgi:hypothetical protein